MVVLRGDHLLTIKCNMNNKNLRDYTKRSKGFGDTIHKITKASGIEAVTQFGAKLLGKKDCGCNKRREALNNKFPYKQQ